MHIVNCYSKLKVSEIISKCKEVIISNGVKK